ncbi:MAG: 2-C-methyl-D-erythritol 4-phosphate cytidylyltransferase, partial [Acetobacteraceae bacterium]|nr:2-C-methyl-D-erythritol 4-phosphate cytidylyltransferase [Acetobacteraceae bacterium]
MVALSPLPASARIACVLVAAGNGQRFGGGRAKQFLTCAGQPVIRHAAAALAAEGVAIQPVGDGAAISAALAGVAHLPPVAGGASRQDSVRAGLAALAAMAPDIVLVHDAARPFIPPGTIASLVAALASHGGAIPAVPVADTLKRGAGGLITATVDRTG